MKNTQQAFEKAVYRSDKENLLSEIKNSNIPKEERIRIYQDNIALTLKATLQNRHPAVLNLVGDDFFRYMSEQFIKENPSTSGNLDEYGLNFHEFISSFKSAQSLPYLTDIAKLELYLHLAYFAADSEAIDASKLSQIKPEELEDIKFNLNQSIHFINSKYPIDKIYYFVTNKNNEDKININKGGISLLIYRPEFKTEILKTELGEYEFLTSLSEGKTLYESFEKATTANPSFDLGIALNKFVQNRVLVN